MCNIPQLITASFRDWVDIRTLTTLSFLGVIGWLAERYVSKRGEAIAQIRPELEMLWDSLNNLERRLNNFAGKKASVFLKGHIIKRDEGEILENVNACGGALSFTGMGLLGGDSTQFSLYAPQWVKKGISRIEDLQKKLHLSVECFNKQWPSGPTLKTLEERNGSKIYDEVSKIGEEADFLKNQVIKFKQNIENELEKKWWCP